MLTVLAVGLVLNATIASLNGHTHGEAAFSSIAGSDKRIAPGETFFLAAENSSAVPFEKDIQAFEEQDRKSPPSADTIFFVGSSTIRIWDLKRCFPQLKTINRGFGGSQYSDVSYYLDRIITPYKPKTVVLYTGDNDLAHGKSVDTIFADFKNVVERIHQAEPKSRIIVLSIKPSPARWKLYPMAKDFNARAAEYIKNNTGMVLVETSGTILGSDGQPRTDVYLPDGLHLNPAGYDSWSALLMPYLTGEK